MIAGIGVDIVDIARIQALLDRHGERFLRRVFTEAELAKIRAAAAFGASIGLKVFAGHGLDVRNIVPILEIPEIEEFNIGHSIIARAIFLGLPAAVKEIADLIHGA